MSPKKNILVLLMVFFCLASEAQYSIAYNQQNGSPLANADVLICQEILDSLHLVRVVIEDDAADNATVTINFPPGINYLDGSLSIIADIGGLSISEVSGSLSNSKVFSISPADLNLGDEITFGYGRVSSCAALDHQLSGGTFKDDITVSGDAGSTTESNINLANYDLLVPAISIFNNGPISTSVGMTVTREIRIVNGGLGYLDLVNLDIDDEQNTSTLSLTTTNGMTLTPITVGSIHAYELDASIISNYGDGDNFLENGEEIVLIRTYEILACACSSSYKASWGCDAICTETEVLPQQTNILNTVPDIVVNIPNINEEICWDGANSLPGGTPVIQTVKVYNAGSGAAVNFVLTMYNYNPGSGRGRHYFKPDPWVIKDAGGSVIGNMVNPQGYDDGWYVSTNCAWVLEKTKMVQEAPVGFVLEAGETVYIEVPTYVSNLDCFDCPVGTSWMQYNTEYSYQDICELNAYHKPRYPLYNGSHNFQRYSLEIPSDVQNGECFDIDINYQSLYLLLRRYVLAGGYTEAVIDLASSGLTYNGGATLYMNGVAVTATVDGDYLRLRFPPNIVTYGQLTVPVCIFL